MDFIKKYYGVIMFTNKIILMFILFLLCCVNCFGSQSVVVYREAGKFCGWPANNGVWSWDNEILVGFEIGNYLYNVNVWWWGCPLSQIFLCLS